VPEGSPPEVLPKGSRRKGSPGNGAPGALKNGKPPSQTPPGAGRTLPTIPRIAMTVWDRWSLERRPRRKGIPTGVRCPGNGYNNGPAPGAPPKLGPSERSAGSTLPPAIAIGPGLALLFPERPVTTSNGRKPGPGVGAPGPHFGVGWRMVWSMRSSSFVFWRALRL